VIAGVTKQMIDQCAARDNSTACKGEFGTSSKCRWTCSGPVMEQPEICGFQARRHGPKALPWVILCDDASYPLRLCSL
jgi:hypothetical protein